LLALAISFWLIDMLKIRAGVKFFAIVGMNPLFIYLFTQTGGEEWFRNIVRPFCLGLFGWAGERLAQLVVSIAVLALLWSLCYWLYKRKIFIRV
jgi:predicted acyltransferase